MVRIVYIESNGTEHVQEVPPGSSVMEGAVRGGVPGIWAECGGACICGTCRVFVDEAWRDRTGSQSQVEEDMLEVHEDKTPGQRLSCQMRVTEDWDGLIVRLPESQY